MQAAIPVVVLPGAFQTVLGSLKTRIEPPKSDENLVPIDVSWQQETKILSEPSAADVPLVVDYILQRCHGQGASDVHLEPTEEGMIVRARLDGILHEQSRMPLSLHSAVVSRIKVLGRNGCRGTPAPAGWPHSRHDSAFAPRTSAFPRCPPCWAKRS